MFAYLEPGLVKIGDRIRVILVDDKGQLLTCLQDTTVKSVELSPMFKNPCEEIEF